MFDLLQCKAVSAGGVQFEQLKLDRDINAME